MTLELAAPPHAPLVQAGIDALARALERPCDAWIREEGRWTCPAGDVLLPGEDLESLTDLLDSVATGQRPSSMRVDSGRVVVAAPLVDASGIVAAVAVATIDARLDALALRLIDAVLRDCQQRHEIEWLREENFVFSHQVTDDFEELTFLRHMATRLVIDDTALGIDDIVGQAIADLREMIGSEAIFFLTAAGSGKLEMTRCCPAKPDDEPPFEADAILRLAEFHRDRAVHGPCVRNDLRETDPAAADAGVRQFLMAPIGVGDRQFGWFVAVNRTNFGRHWAPSPLLQIGEDEFGTWEASLLSTAATLLASHASNLELLREKEQLLINTVRSLVTALDAKDAYTRGHSERVALFSKRIAEQIGYDPLAADRLYLAGLLHDVGKIGVSDATLRKPGKLTPEEFTEIRRHPDEGWAILRDLEQLSYVLPAVLHHHERVTGGGYPDGLKGEGIPLDARIMAVADAYDAMTSDRAYRGGMPHDTAIQIIRDGAGGQWDAAVVDAFLAVVDDIVAIRYGYHQFDRPFREDSALAPSCQAPG